ncbi:hypothetical protein BCR44DRAFT_72262 [Catenaria anguillulae PL171]|uniref:Uncharacterized protein n=1 Tax=Catenaria anguillulae PL171 TaxID=765915 RepID=A0A1Y2H7R9_9FUNG|nr:hypothetical protein BCR44DRAFT_72262 [Catenaria anguillulae PL171]
MAIHSHWSFTLFKLTSIFSVIIYSHSLPLPSIASPSLSHLRNRPSFDSRLISFFFPESFHILHNLDSIFRCHPTMRVSILLLLAALSIVLSTNGNPVAQPHPQQLPQLPQDVTADDIANVLDGQGLSRDMLPPNNAASESGDQPPVVPSPPPPPASPSASDVEASVDPSVVSSVLASVTSGPAVTVSSGAGTAVTATTAPISGTSSAGSAATATDTSETATATSSDSTSTTDSTTSTDTSSSTSLETSTAASSAASTPSTRSPSTTSSATIGTATIRPIPVPSATAGTGTEPSAANHFKSPMGGLAGCMLFIVAVAGALHVM